MISSKKTVPILVAALLVTSANAALGQEKPEPAIEIRAVEIYSAPLPEPRLYRDSEGLERTAEDVLIVELEGDFGKARAIPVEIYIGDYKVEEYGGSEKGIYFKVYDPELLSRLEGRQLAYGFQGQKVRTLELRFQPSELKPFPRLSAPWPAPKEKPKKD